MKTVLSFLLIVFLLPFAKSQQIGYKLKSGKILHDKISERTVGITDLGSINGQAYFLYPPYIAVFNQACVGCTENYFIGRFDKDLNLVDRAEIILKHDDKELTCEGVLNLKDKFVVFSSFKNTKDKKHYLFAQSMDSQTLKLSPNIKLIGELDYSGLNKFNNTIFNYELSPDSSTILIFYTLITKKNEALRTGMYVCDHDMNIKWKDTDVEAKFTEGVFSYDRFKVDNEGNAYLLGRHYMDKKNYFDEAHFNDLGFFSKDTYFTDKPNYTFQLYRYSNVGKKQETYSISLQDKFIRSLNFFPSEGNTIICTGMYGSPGKISVEGSFAFTYHLDSKEVSNLSTKELGPELISLGFDQTELKRFKRSIDNKQEWDPFEYILSEVYTKKNGDKYFIAEQYISGTKMERSGNTVTYTAIYMHNDLYVVTLNKDYQIKRIDKIYKRQYWLNNDFYNSYASLEKNGSLYFMYNTFESTDKMFKNIEMGDSYIARLDENGKVDKTVFWKKEEKGQPVPVLKSGIVMPDSSIVYSLLSFRWKDYQVQQISITE